MTAPVRKRKTVMTIARIGKVKVSLRSQKRRKSKNSAARVMTRLVKSRIMSRAKSPADNLAVSIKKAQPQTIVIAMKLRGLRNSRNAAARRRQRNES